MEKKDRTSIVLMISHDLKGSFVKDIGERHIYRWYSKKMFQGFARRQAKLFASFVSGNFSHIENLYKFIYKKYIEIYRNISLYKNFDRTK